MFHSADIPRQLRPFGRVGAAPAGGGGGLGAGGGRAGRGRPAVAAARRLAAGRVRGTGTCILAFVINSILSIKKSVA